MKLIYICHLVLCVLFLNLSFAGEHTEIESKNKAIIDTHDEGRRFKLSEKAVKILNLKTEKIVPSQKGSFLIKKDSLVAFGEELGIFVVQDGWFELIEVKILAKREKGIVISSKNLSNSSELVIAGVPLLRVAQLQASGEVGEGHED